MLAQIIWNVFFFPSINDVQKQLRLTCCQGLSSPEWFFIECWTLLSVALCYLSLCVFIQAQVCVGTFFVIRISVIIVPWSLNSGLLFLFCFSVELQKTLGIQAQFIRVKTLRSYFNQGMLRSSAPLVLMIVAKHTWATIFISPTGSSHLPILKRLECLLPFHFSTSSTFRCVF